MNTKWTEWTKDSRTFIARQKRRSRAALRAYGRRADRREKKNEEGKRPRDADKPVTDSTFLVIPAYPGDVGVRPVPPGTATWHSPAVNVIHESTDPTTPLEIVQGTHSPDLVAGANYVFEAWIHNLGDMVAPAVNVEFFLRRAGMGSTAESADLVGSTVIAVPRNGTARATVSFTATGGDVGHHCLLVRASAFNPPDVPADWSALVAREDRHIGQQNLNVVAGGSTMMMLLSAPPRGRRKNARIRVRVRPTAVPPHLVRSMCGVDLRFRKGLARAAFDLDADGALRRVPRIANAWDLDMRRGETQSLTLTIPRTDIGAIARLYDVEAFDPETKSVFDGITLAVR